MNRRVTGFLVLIAAVVAAGCGTTTKSGNSDAAKTIKVGYQDQIAGGIDPAQFYSVEGNSVILSLYETLLTYKPGTNDLAPSLATKWNVSADGKRYTFTLRDGVKFHDGTTMDSAAVKASFERAIAVAGGPSYMLEQVDKIETPSANQVVITLKKPVSAFLDYNASMYGPKIVSPKAMKAHAGNDDGKRWFSRNAVGTGPFKLASYKASGPIVMNRFDDYWGDKAKPESVEISVIPNIGDQLLRLRSGELSLIAHGVDPAQLPDLENDSELQVKKFPDAVVRPVLILNVTTAPFKDLAARKAFVAAAQLPSVANAVYGDTAKPSTTVAPISLLAKGSDPLPDPGTATAAPNSKQITLTYTNTEVDLRQVAERMQQNLKAKGWKVKLRADSVDSQFGYAEDPKQGPEAALTTMNPDAAHPATWLDPIYKTAGGLNLLGFSDPAVDKLLDQADATVDRTAADALYARAATAIGAQFYTIPVADRSDVFVADANLDGFTHVPTYIWTVNYADLEAK